MNQNSRIKLIKEAVAEINLTRGHPILIVSGLESQWARGNASIKRDNSNIGTLSLNIKDSGILVGCDGVKAGINSYLKENLEFNNRNTQNTRYKCPDSQIKNVISYYAQFKI